MWIHSRGVTGISSIDQIESLTVGLTQSESMFTKTARGKKDSQTPLKLASCFACFNYVKMTFNDQKGTIKYFAIINRQTKAVHHPQVKAKNKPTFL